MRKVYLLGGERIRKRDGERVNRQAFNAAGGSPEVLVFSWARANFDQIYQRQELVYNYLRYLGANSVTVVDYSTTQQEIREKFSQADLIYITGGSPSILIERFKHMHVDDLLKTFNGVIVGRSAGALALCTKCIVTIRATKQTKIIDGLGIVNLTMSAHYTRKKDAQLKELSRNNQIFAVPKGSALIFTEPNILSRINEVILFKNGKRDAMLQLLRC
ncbi:MAG: Type 1 glutamine amidotransferase-like domain-containing protein [Candidatus Bathyarchaeota archaeon]|nr:Type 1 glutamine amidotransferase-like domain-containing protein [Candidatus Termiticorpusculum sp.]MCL1971328.1 Type 1 glutamine amidotransferase-like domain-containing protein [Candidatus Termiticorpusculum sp.]